MMKKKSVKLKDIAIQAEVSVATVSAALNGTGRIGDELRSRIMELSSSAMNRASAARLSITIRM